MSELNETNENPFDRFRFEVAKSKFKAATIEAVAIGGLAAIVCPIEGGKIGAISGVVMGVFSGLYGGMAIEAHKTMSQLAPELGQNQIAED